MTCVIEKEEVVELLKKLGHRIIDVEDDMWIIAKEIDAHVNELFIEIERLRKKCNDNKQTYRCRKCSREISKEIWDGDRICKKCKTPTDSRI